MTDLKPNLELIPSLPVDYLVIGHITSDLTEAGPRLGGTATFSGLTARALGLRVAIVTSFHADLDLTPLNDVTIHNSPSLETTTFKNLSDGVHREQFLYAQANPLNRQDLPPLKTPPAIVHLGPVANEVDPEALHAFPDSLICLTPQGWFRSVDAERKVHVGAWEQAEHYLSLADAAVISLEDVHYDEKVIARMASSAPVFVVTEGFRGARVYWHNDARYFNAPKVEYRDDTGAGDIFSAAFFYRYLKTKDPWEAGRFAVNLASWSVTRTGLESIPTANEIQNANTEILGR